MEVETSLILMWKDKGSILSELETSLFSVPALQEQ